MSRRDGMRSTNVAQVYPIAEDPGKFGVRFRGCEGQTLLVSPSHYPSAATAKTQMAKLRQSLGRMRVEVVDIDGRVID